MRCYICDRSPYDELNHPYTGYRRPTVNYKYEGPRSYHTKHELPQWICSGCEIAVKYDFDANQTVEELIESIVPDN